MMTVYIYIARKRPRFADSAYKIHATRARGAYVHSEPLIAWAAAQATPYTVSSVFGQSTKKNASSSYSRAFKTLENLMHLGVAPLFAERPRH